MEKEAEGYEVAQLSDFRLRRKAQNAHAFAPLEVKIIFTGCDKYKGKLGSTSAGNKTLQAVSGHAVPIYPE